MENFVFPDEITTKLMNIFPILTGIPQKSCKRSCKTDFFLKFSTKKKLENKKPNV